MSNDDIVLDLGASSAADETAEPLNVTAVTTTKVQKTEPINNSQSIESKQLDAVLTELSVDQGLGFETYMDGGVRDGSQSIYLSIRSGAQFIAAKNMLADGATDMSVSFKDHLKAADYPQQRASEDMRLAQAYIALPASKRKSFINMGKVKAIKLASLDTEQIADLVESNPDVLDEFASMNRKELTEQIKRLKHANVNQAAELETTQSQLKRAQHKTHATNFEFETETVRLETMHLQGEFELSLNGIEKLFNRVTNDIETEEKPLRIEHVYLAAMTALARATDLVERLKAYPFDYPARPAGAHTLSAEESAAWIQAFSTMQARRDGEELMRSNARENQKPGKRGPKHKKAGAK